jgi:hypothetical protein
VACQDDDAGCHGNHQLSSGSSGRWQAGPTVRRGLASNDARSHGSQAEGTGRQWFITVRTVLRGVLVW